MNYRVKITAAACMAVALLWAPFTVSAEEDQQGPPPSLVKVDTVIVETFGQTAPTIGRLVSRQSGVVAARISGAIAHMNVQIGDRVAEGDTLAELVADKLQWEVKRNEAALQRAEAELAIRKNEMQRLRSLRNSAAFQQSRYDDTRLEVATLEARVIEAKSLLELANLDLDYTNVRAPYAGTVTLRHTEAGSYVSTGAPVVTIVNDLELEAEGDVPSDRIDGLTIGRNVAMEIAGERVNGTVRALVAVENPLTRTRAVRFSIPTDVAPSFTPNQTVTIFVPVGERDEVVTVHKDAVVNRLGETIVFTIKDNMAEMRSVRLGEPVGSRFVVLSGLEPGEQAAVRGNERLRAGQTVTVDEGV